MPTSDPPNQQGSINNRRDDRHEINFTAQLIINKDVHAAAIDNISVGGAKLKTLVPVSVEKDTACTLRVESLGDFNGAIAWCRSGAVGVSFVDSDWRIADAIMALATYS